MSNNGNDSPLAVDIITYIGVPLTVLGILPILYNTIVTLAAVAKIKRTLRKSQLTALTRSDVVNRVIEIELPRYAVTPWDRFQHRQEYWTLSRCPSGIPGGSWTTFNWKTSAIGIKTQRIEYADQLRQPQVEVAFDELVCYLLDLGAVPDPQGWRLLRSTGQWTPVGCALMKSPDGQHKALTIAPADDSDGNLSLAVNWDRGWTARDHFSLPPYWVRLYPAPPPPALDESDADENLLIEPVASASASASAATPTTTATSNPFESDLEKGAKKQKTPTGLSSKKSLDSVQRAIDTNSRSAITCKISSSGLDTALTQETGGESAAAHFNSLYIEHLRIGRLPPAYSRSTSFFNSGTHPTQNPAPGAFPPTSSAATRTPFRPGPPTGTSAAKTSGVWFASAITAYGQSTPSTQPLLWNYSIPPSILSFARKPSVPCGILVLLDLVPMDETPLWSSSLDAERKLQQQEHEKFHARSRETHRAMQAEMKLPPKERSEAARVRLMKESEGRLQDMREKLRQKEEREEGRLLEALQSPRWECDKVAGYCLRWLRAHRKVGEGDGAVAAAGDVGGGGGGGGGGGVGVVGSDRGEAGLSGLEDVVGGLLHRMVLDGGFAARVSGLLDEWQGWAENGGMRKADFESVRADVEGWAMGTLFVALISHAAGALEGTLAVDLHDCLGLWRKVRLG